MGTGKEVMEKWSETINYSLLSDDTGQLTRDGYHGVHVLVYVPDTPSENACRHSLHAPHS
jgi:hypothetical protein